MRFYPKLFFQVNLSARGLNIFFNLGEVLYEILPDGILHSKFKHFLRVRCVLFVATEVDAAYKTPKNPYENLMRENFSHMPMIQEMFSILYMFLMRTKNLPSSSKRRNQERRHTA